jgi:hypothetical protein
MKKVLVLAVVVLASVLAATSQPAGATTAWNVGDVFAAVSNGQYKVFDGGGAFKETLDDGMGGFTTGCSFNPALDRLYTTNFTASRVVAYDNASPHNIDQDILTAPASAESIVFDLATGDFYVGHADGNQDIERYNAAGMLQQTYDVPVGPRGSDWIELAADGQTMFYTSEGRTIRRYDVSGAGAPLPDFAALPGPGVAFALRLLPPGDGSGGLLVADFGNVKRLAGDGSVIETYDVTGADSWFSLNLDPDGVHFWSGDIFTGKLHKFKIGMPGVDTHVQTIDTGAPGLLFGVCIKGEFSPITVDKDYRFTNVCFERDNDGDGAFNEDPVDLIDNDGDGMLDEDGPDCATGTSLGDLLPTDADGNFVLQAVLKKDGTVASYNPGQYYAVSGVEVLRDIPSLEIWEDFGDCTEAPKMLSALNPPSGGGSVVIVDVGPDGIAKQIADANSPGVSVSDANANGIPDDAHAALGAVSGGHTILMYVKFEPGLKGKTVPAPPNNTCENENEAMVEQLTQSATANLTVVPK